MSHTIIPTNFNSGVKRLRPTGTLAGAWRMMGAMGDAVSDDVDAMESEGYDSATLDTLVALGVTDAQLQDLWNNYGAGTPEFSDAVQTLIAQLSMSSMTATPPTMTTSAAGAAYGAVSAAVSSVVSSALGAFDLSTQAGWSGIASILTSVQQSVNQAAAKNPSDPVVISQVSTFNSLVMQFATYYSQATGTSLSPIPMASIPTLARYLGDAGFTYSQTVWGTLIGPIGDLLNALYPIWTWAKNFIATNQQINLNTSAAAQTNASSVSALTTQYLGLQNQISSAQSSGNTALASTLTAQANSVLSAITKLGGTTPTPTPTTLPSFSAWFETNWPWLALALGAVVIVPPLLKKI